MTLFTYVIQYSPKIQKLCVYSRPYVYFFRQIFQALRLLAALRLFRSLEYYSILLYCHTSTIKHEFAKRSQNGQIAKITNHANYLLFLFVFQAFSVFFICIAVTSDMICFLFIPVHWLFFAASTYVWVQYVWHTGKGQSINNVIIFFHRHFNPSLPNRSPLFLCLV